jgi:hypothetical protein
MRIKFAMNMHNKIVRFNILVKNEILKKQEQEKRRKNEEKMRKILKKIILIKTKPKTVLPFLRFSF